MARTQKKRRAKKRRINALNSASLKHRTDRCMNPFKVIGHVGTNLRKVTGAMLEKFSDLHEKDKICNSCRKLGFECNPKPKKKKKRNSKVANTAQSETNDDMNITQSETNDDINSTQSGTNDDVIDENDTRSEREKELEQILSNIKLKYSTLEKHDPLKIQLLTIVPDSWSVRKIVKEFNTSQWLAAKSKHLKKSNGVFGKVSEKKGKTLSDEIVNKIKSFYNMNDNS